MRKPGGLSVRDQVCVSLGSYPSEAAPLATEYMTSGNESGANELGREDSVPVCTDSESLLTTICCDLLYSLLYAFDKISSTVCR
jgi:hypothetical protein